MVSGAYRQILDAVGPFLGVKDIAAYATLCTYGLIEAGSLLYGNASREFGGLRWVTLACVGLRWSTMALGFDHPHLPIRLPTTSADLPKPSHSNSTNSVICAALCYDLTLRKHKLPPLKLRAQAPPAVKSHERQRELFHLTGAHNSGITHPFHYPSSVKLIYSWRPWTLRLLAVELQNLAHAQAKEGGIRAVALATENIKISWQHRLKLPVAVGSAQLEMDSELLKFGATCDMFELCLQEGDALAEALRVHFNAATIEEAEEELESGGGGTTSSKYEHDSEEEGEDVGEVEDGSDQEGEGGEAPGARETRPVRRFLADMLLAEAVQSNGYKGMVAEARAIDPTTQLPARLRERCVRDGFICMAPGCWALTAEDGGKLRDCSRCKRARYHSKTCQKAHWCTHRLVCGKVSE